MCKILCIFRNLHGVKFADFNFISLFTRFASFATSASSVLPFKFNTENAILFTCCFTKFTLNKFSIKLILKINLSHRKAGDNEFYRPKGAKMKLYLLQKSELVLGTVFFICSLFYLDFYLQSGILGGETIQFVLFSFPLALAFNILMLAVNFKRTRAIFFALIGAFILCIFNIFGSSIIDIGILFGVTILFYAVAGWRQNIGLKLFFILFAATMYFWFHNFKVIALKDSLVLAGLLASCATALFTSAFSEKH